MATKFNKYQYVELLIGVGQGTVNFTPQQYLQNRQVYSMEVFNNADVPQARSNNNIATPAMIAGMFLNLYCNDANKPLQAIPNSDQYNGQAFGQWFKDIPLVTLHRSITATNTYVRDLFELYGELIDFEQSYVNITPTAQALITTPVVALFGVGYK